MLTGHVRVWNETGTLRANRLEIYYTPGSDTVDHIRARGDVRFSTEDLFARGQYAYQDMGSDTVFLQEDAYVRRGPHEFWSDRIRVNLETRRVSLRLSVRGSLDTEERLLPRE